MRAHCRYNCQPTPRLVGGIQWVAGVQRMRSRDIAHTRQPSAVKATSALNLELSIEMTEPTAPLTQADIPALVKAATEALKARTQTEDAEETRSEDTPGKQLHTPTIQIIPAHYQK